MLSNKIRKIADKISRSRDAIEIEIDDKMFYIEDWEITPPVSQSWDYPGDPVQVDVTKVTYENGEEISQEEYEKYIEVNDRIVEMILEASAGPDGPDY